MITARWGLASLEISSGRFSLSEFDGDELLNGELQRLSPAEIIYCEDQSPPLEPVFSQQAHAMPPWYFELDSATRLLCEQYRVRDLQGFGIEESSQAISAARGGTRKNRADTWLTSPARIIASNNPTATTELPITR